LVHQVRHEGLEVRTLAIPSLMLVLKGLQQWQKSNCGHTLVGHKTRGVAANRGCAHASAKKGLKNLHFHGKYAAFSVLPARLVVQPLEPNNPPASIFHEHNIIVNLFADRLLGRIIEPNRQGVTRAIIIDSYFFHWSPA
jgi:hypothetical protein